MNATHWIARMQLLGARAESAAKASAMSPDRLRAPGCCSGGRLRRSRSLRSSPIGRRRGRWFVKAAL